MATYNVTLERYVREVVTIATDEDNQQAAVDVAQRTVVAGIGLWRRPNSVQDPGVEATVTRPAVLSVFDAARGRLKTTAQKKGA